MKENKGRIQSPAGGQGPCFKSVEHLAGAGRPERPQKKTYLTQVSQG